MAKELSVLQQQAEAIKTEVNKGANTSSRIGGMFGDMLEYNEEKLTELESKSNQYRGTNTIQAKVGIEYVNKIPIKIKTGDFVTVEVVGDSSVFSTNDLNLYFGEIKQNINATVGQIKIITANEDAEYLYIKRASESVVGNGDITLNVGILQYYTRQEMNDFMSKQNHINNKSNLSSDFSLSQIGQKINIPEKKSGYYYDASGQLVENENSQYYDSIDISSLTGNIVIYIDNPTESSSRCIIIKDINGNIVERINENSIYVQDTIFDGVKAISMNIDGVYQAKELLISLSNSAEILSIACNNSLKNKLNCISYKRSYIISNGNTVNIPLDIIVKQGDIMEIKASYDEDALGSSIYLRELESSSNNIAINNNHVVLHKFESNSKSPIILNFTQSNKESSVTLDIRVYSEYFYEITTQDTSTYSKTKKATINTEYINSLNCFIKKNNMYSVDIVGNSGILSSNLIGSIRIYYIDGTNETIASSVSSVSYNGIFTAKKDIYLIDIARSASGVVSEGDITLTVCNNVTKKVLKEQYISPDGNDENEGTEENPKRTINACLQSRANTIIVKAGAYNQRINIGLTSEKNIIIRNCDTNNKAIFRNTDYVLASSSTLVSGKVYKCTPISSFNFNSNNKWLFQDGISDVNTLISDDERNPYQRGVTYRCDSTKIELCTSSDLESAIEEIESSDENKWYYNSSTNEIYFSSPTQINNNNPLCWSNGSFISNADRSKSIIFENIETRYMVFNVDSLNARLENCVSKYVYGGGAFSYTNGIVTFNRCEAARCFSGTVGDGYNGHATKVGDSLAKTCVCTLTDCWSHDNNDDGYSDHERAETTIYGGLYEYNGKAGVTPSYGSHCNCFNVYSRKNYVGFRYTGAAAEDEGGKYGQCNLFGCISENNTRNPNGTSYGYYVDGNGNMMKCINCFSIGHKIGFFASGAIINIVNSYSDDTAKTGGTGTINVKNTVIVE